MLTPEFLDVLPDTLIKLYAQAEPSVVVSSSVSQSLIRIVAKIRRRIWAVSYTHLSRVACPVPGAGTCPAVSARDEGRGTARRICERLEIPLESLCRICRFRIYQKSRPLGHRCRVSDEELRVPERECALRTVHGRRRLLPEIPVGPVQNGLSLHRRFRTGRL